MMMEPGAKPNYLHLESLFEAVCFNANQGNSPLHGSCYSQKGTLPPQGLRRSFLSAFALNATNLQPLAVQ